MAIINYYEKYGLLQTDDLDKIQWVINQKITDEENDSFGEGHSDRMFILQLAKEAFATAESKENYDTQLADSLKKRDPDGERKAAFDKWYEDAGNYCNTGQHDLAKTAIDRAMQYTTPETVESSFYITAASIYHNLKLYSQSLDLSNQAIVLSPDEARGYFLKSVTLYSYMFEKNLGNEKMQDIWQQLKSNCELTISKVIAQESEYEKASKCYEYLTEMYYVFATGAQFPITGRDNALAEEYAMKAISILNSQNPDECIFARRILDDIASRRAKIAELEKANEDLRAQLKKDNDEIEREISNLKRTVSAQKASISDATTYGSTEFGTEIWVGIIAAIIGIICLIVGVAIAFLFILIAIAVFGLKGAIIAKNKRIRTTLASIRENEQAISSNEYKITNNKREIDGKIANNDRIIAQEGNGLAPVAANNI